jgi:hypothetical protein
MDEHEAAVDARWPIEVGVDAMVSGHDDDLVANRLGRQARQHRLAGRKRETGGQRQRRRVPVGKHEQRDAHGCRGP